MQDDEKQPTVASPIEPVVSGANFTQSALSYALSKLPPAHEFFEMFGVERRYPIRAKESVFSKEEITLVFRLQTYSMGDSDCYEWVIDRFAC